MIKISDTECKCFTMSDNNKFTNDILDPKIKKKNQLINLIFLHL